MTATINPVTLRTVVLALVLAGACGWAASPATAPESGPAATVAGLLDQAKDLGAKDQLPNTWWDLEQRYKEARDGGAAAATWATLEGEAVRLVNQAAFIREMRRRKSPLEALLGRFDQALVEIGALYGVAPNPRLSGSEAAADLVERLNAENLKLQVRADSLAIANRMLVEQVGGSAAARESLVTTLQAEVSTLRRQLWEMELRAGVAEADRSAAETVLSRKQQRERAVDQVRGLFTPEEADVLLTADEDVVLRVHGIDFAVGSAALQGAQLDLVARIAEAIALFPGATVRIEGHTDDTGSRDANLRLSRRRAESVAAAVAEKLGREASDFTTDGYGPDRPVALNSTPEGRALNRRIDVVIGAAP